MHTCAHLHTRNSNKIKYQINKENCIHASHCSILNVTCHCAHMYSLLFLYFTKPLIKKKPTKTLYKIKYVLKLTPIFKRLFDETFQF